MKDCLKSKANNTDDYDQKQMKIKFHSDGHSLLKEMLELHNMMAVVRTVFHEDNKHYPQAFLAKCLYIL